MGIPVKNTAKRLLALGASTALLVGTVGVVGASSADAAVITTVLGQVGVSNPSASTTGNINQNINFTTAAGCPVNDGAAHATNYAQVTINGGNPGKTWPNVVLVGTTTNGVSHSGAQSFTISDTFANIGAGAGLANPQGSYDVTVTCQDATGVNQSGVFKSQFVFDASGNFTVNPPVLGALSAQVGGATVTSIGAGDAVTWATPAGCAAPGTFFHVVIDGWPLAASPITPPDPVDLVGTTAAGVSTSAPFTVSQADILSTIQSGNSLAALTNGASYPITGYCGNSLQTVITGTFTTTMVWNSASNSGALVNSVATSTTLAAPANIVVGANATLTATITPASGTLPAGSVTFTDENSATVGSAQSTVAGATATATVSASGYGVGTHTFLATWTTSDTGFTGSSSLPVTVVVKTASPTAVVSITPTPDATAKLPNIGTIVSLKCTVSGGFSGPSQATFTYTFGGTTTTTAAQSITSSVATFTFPGLLAAGNLTGVRCNTVADANNSAATSNTIASTTIYSIVPTQVATEFIDVHVNAGALTLTVKGIPLSTTAKTGTPVNSPTYPAAPAVTTPLTNATIPADSSTNVVILPNADVNAAGTFIETSGNILPVEAVDRRAGAPGFNVTGILGELAGVGGGATSANKINPANVGWTPAFIACTAVPTALIATDCHVTDGGPVAAAAGLQPSVSSALGLQGTKTMFTVPAQTAGGYSGTFWYGALLALKAPTNTAAGDYEGVLTLTANG
jgi:hypothetical protein